MYKQIVVLVYLASVFLTFTEASVPQCKSMCEDVDGTGRAFCQGLSCLPEVELQLCHYNSFKNEENNYAGHYTSNQQECPINVDTTTEEGCKRACAEMDECHVYTWEDLGRGSACYLLSSCTEASHGNGFKSGRDCSSCPKAEYIPSLAAVHWNCTQGWNLYQDELPDQTVCWPLHRCYNKSIARLPGNITCQDGHWVKDDVDHTVVEPEDIDQLCECSILKIPVKGDTTVFCDPAIDGANEYWELGHNVTKCNMVCDGTDFVPITCKLPIDGTDEADRQTTKWHVNYAGTEFPLPPEEDCVACSFNYCNSDSSRSNGEGRKKALTLEDIKRLARQKKILDAINKIGN